MDVSLPAMSRRVRQLREQEIAEVVAYRWEAVGLLKIEALEAFRAARVRFDSEPDRFGLGGTAWAVIESEEGTRYVLVHHDHAPMPVLEVRALAGSASAAELVERLCRAVALDRRLVVTVEGESTHALGTSEALPPERLLDRLMFRLRHCPPRYMSSTAMARIPARYATYPSPGQRAFRGWRSWLAGR